MVTGRRVIQRTHLLVFELPLDAREIEDAIRQVENEFPHSSFDDRYMVKTDGLNLIFYWEGGTE